MLAECSKLDGDFDYSQCETLIIFTDGSGGSSRGHLPGPPAWAFVVLGITHDGALVLIGTLGDAMPTLSESFSQPSGAAEICAGIVAVLWLLQLQTIVDDTGKSVPLPEVCFRTDNKYVVDIGLGGASLDHYDPYASFLDSVVKVLRRLAEGLHWSHVSGHMADPWNELADTVATLARGGLIAWPNEFDLWERV